MEIRIIAIELGREEREYKYRYKEKYRENIKIKRKIGIEEVIEMMRNADICGTEIEIEGLTEEEAYKILDEETRYRKKRYRENREEKEKRALLIIGGERKRITERGKRKIIKEALASQIKKGKKVMCIVEEVEKIREEIERIAKNRLRKIKKGEEEMTSKMIEGGAISGIITRGTNQEIKKIRGIETYIISGKGDKTRDIIEAIEKEEKREERTEGKIIIVMTKEKTKEGRIIKQIREKWEGITKIYKLKANGKLYN